MRNRIICAALMALTLFMSASAQRVFRHPGSILSKADLERIKQHVDAGDEPWASCWTAMQQDACAKTTYTAKATAEIGGSNGTRQRAAQDAYAAMLNAIEWHITGQTAYADCAARILTAWGKTLETANAELYQYPCRAMIVAAEMLRTEEGFYSGWDEADREAFLDKVRTVMVPACRKFCTYQGTHPSWYTPAALGVLAGGVLLDDETMYQEGYNLMTATDHWGTMFGGSIEPSGQMREMGRDNVHGGLTLGDIAQACLVAWNQGDDLFGEGDNRLLKGMEYWCRYNTGHTDVPYEPLDCSGLDGATGYSFYYISTHNNGFRLQPDACAFEAVYHHYKEVKGMDEETLFPYLGIAARLARPDNRADQMLGYGTLFFTINAETSPYMTEKPQRPEEVKAEAGIGCVHISWQHPVQEDARGFKIFRSDNGQTFSLLKTWDYYTNNTYKDEEVEPGKTYYYKVQLTNKAGSSQQSEVVNACVPEPTGELPQGWRFMAIGTELGEALFTPEQDTSFIVSGAGTDIGGTADSEGFLYKKMTGDATLTVRLVSVIEDFYKVGIQVRSTLAAGAQRVGITLGEKGYRMLRTYARSDAGGSTSWTNGTNYGKAPMWMRIQRKANQVSTYISRDNITWHKLTTITLSMPKDYYIGMASCSGSVSKTYSAMFDHVYLEGTEAAPAYKPATPTRFTAAWSGTEEATLTWSPAVEADEYLVYRDGALIGTTRATRYTDTAATTGTHTYYIVASNALGESAASTSIEVTTGKVEKITGSVIGTTGSYGNNSSRTRTAALDGYLDTFFDAAETSGAWVGYDLGTRYTAQVVYVKYAPRSGYPARMTGGRFQVANKADFSDAVTIATVTDTPTEGVLTQLTAPSSPTQRYRYLRYIGPDNGNCNVSEVQFYGSKVDETEVGIMEVPRDGTGSQNGADATYDLCGRQAKHPARGIYIQNGKKIFIR